MKRTNLLLFTLLSICLCACTQKGNQAESISQEASYPVAEWDKATAILMHTPGQELFDGVIHPSSGLFENYFDVDKAADEHRGYISALEKNGIKVFTVEQILNETPIEKLREYAKNSLTFDISNIPDANTEENDNYRMKVLGEMSRADLIRCILLQPTVALYPTDNNTGVEAVYTHRPLMNLYFTRDQSLTTPRGHIICQMNSTQRTPETSIIALCYEQLAIKPILEISGEGRIEGGDYIPAGNVSLIGCGMRTNIEAIRQIMNADAFGHDTIAVVKDHKWWQMQMHLDTYFNIIDKDLCTMVESRLYAKEGDPEWVTVDLYSRPAGKKEYHLTQQDLSFVQYLKDNGFSIIPIKEEDELHYANNYLTIAPRHIMAVAGQSEELQQDFKRHGVKVEWIPLESLIDGYGAAHCMTQVLSRIAVK